MTGLLDRLSAIGADIKVAHSVFALPFALLASFLAAGGFPGGVELVLIVVCMIFARTFAMLANRYLDREIDRDNPRTAGRALPAGRLRPGDVLVAMIICAVGLIAGAAAFGLVNHNWLPLYASPVVLLWLWAYGLFKRFTVLAHFFLGGALAISPLAAGLAIRPESLMDPTLWWLAGFVALWVAGFDVIYAIQDLEFDQENQLHSIPAVLGRAGALLTAKAVHIGAIVMLLMADRTSLELSQLFRIGLIIVAMLLIIEHRLASKNQFTMAFFTVNGIISLLLGGLGIIDVMMASTTAS